MWRAHWHSAQRCGECDLVVSKSQVSGRQQAAAVTADSDLDQGRPIKWPRAAQLLAAGTWGAVGGRAELLALLACMPDRLFALLPACVYLFVS